MMRGNKLFKLLAIMRRYTRARLVKVIDGGIRKMRLTQSNA